MRANLYIGVLIGVLIFVAIMWYQNRKSVEGFADAEGKAVTPPAEPASTPVPSSFESILAALNADPTNYKYVEKKENIPGHEKLQLYYSSFSDKTLANEDTYQPTMQRWNNHLASEQAYFLLSRDALPVTIKPPHGLPTKNITMNGIPSDKLNPSSATHTLGSFTLSCYTRFNSIVFTENNPIEVFNIYLESPNYARMELRPKLKEDKSIDPDNVDIALQIGNSENVYTVTKPKDAILASGNYILLTFVYDESSGKVFLYIGSNENDNYNAVVTPKPTLVLGNSPIRLNGMATLDMNLQALALYTTALTFETHKALLTYFIEQQSGVASILEALKVMSTAQIAAVQNYVQDQTVTIEDLKKQLEVCEATPKKEEEKKFKYGIPLPEGAEGVSATDLEGCSILGVKKRGEAALPKVTLPESVVAATASKDATATATAAPQNRFSINVPFLKDILPKAFSTESVTPTAPKA